MSTLREKNLGNPDVLQGPSGYSEGLTKILLEFRNQLKKIKPGFKIWLCLSLAVISACLHLPEAPREYLFVHFINVGYGDSALVEFPDGKNMLIDSGGKEKALAVLNYLQDKRIKTLDTVLITHPDEDHLGGIIEIVAKIKVNTIITSDDITKNKSYLALYDAVKSKDIELKVARKSDTIRGFKNSHIEILHPDKLRDSGNDSSVVFKLIYSRVSFLFTGDIGPEVCELLVKGFGKKLKSDILKVPWHGKSKSENFLKAVRPKLAVITVGPSKYYAPFEEVLKSYSRLKINVLRTDKAGTIVVKTDGNKFWVSAQR